MCNSIEGYSILGFHRNRVAGCPRPFARPPAVKFAPCEPRRADRADKTNLHDKGGFPNCFEEVELLSGREVERKRTNQNSDHE